MRWIDDENLTGLGDLVDFLPPGPITFPIRRLIKSDAERAGIDIHNPCRSVASLLGSCGMATALGAFLGPPGGILGGLLGYVVAMGSDYEGDRPKSAYSAEEEALYLLELKAFQIAAEVTESLVDRETWDDICEVVCDEINMMADYFDQPKSLSSTIVLLEVVSESIRDVDVEAHFLFTTAYEAAREEIGLLPEASSFESTQYQSAMATQLSTEMS
jgi:hypothetical protein